MRNESEPGLPGPAGHPVQLLMTRPRSTSKPCGISCWEYEKKKTANVGISIPMKITFSK